ncbi:MULTISPECIES: phage holin family protein [Paenibacillus]|nr:phage holin family protein [Paenibacillus borealis]
MLNHSKNIVTTVYTAAIGSSNREIVAGATSAGAGLLAMAAGWLGGDVKPLEFLVVLMLADYVSGVAGAFKTKIVSSDIMFWGGVRKITVLFVVGLAALIDDWVQPGARW